MLLNFEENKAEISFKKEILPITENINPQFNYYFEKQDVVLILNQKPLFFIFLHYAPFGSHTTLASYKDSISNIQGIPRASKGEWVVEIVYKCNPSDAENLLRKLKNKQNEESSIINFIRDELSKF